MYGESEQGLAETLKESVEDAKVTMDKVLGAMPQLSHVIDIVHDFVEQRGYVETILGHRRRLPEAMSKANFGAKSRALRQSFNALIQGSGANTTNTALIEIRKQLRERGFKAKIVATVHDSIVIDVPRDEVLIVPLMAKFIMEHVALPQFIVNMDRVPDLKVADKYKINDKQFRFPLFAEIEFGQVYGQELEFDVDKIKQMGLDNYMNFAKEEKFINDSYNTKLGKAKEQEEKEQILEQQEQALKDLEIKYQL